MSGNRVGVRRDRTNLCTKMEPSRYACIRRSSTFESFDTIRLRCSHSSLLQHMSVMAAKIDTSGASLSNRNTNQHVKRKAAGSIYRLSGVQTTGGAPSILFTSYVLVMRSTNEFSFLLNTSGDFLRSLERCETTSTLYVHILTG